MDAIVTPMLQVPDVRAAALWYRSIGFAIGGWHACNSDEMGHGDLPQGGEELDWALVQLGQARIMFNAGGQSGNAQRREVDLYVDIKEPPGGQGVDALYVALKDRVDVVEAPYDAFHGNREFIIRDLNGFWIIFAHPVAIDRQG